MKTKTEKELEKEIEELEKEEPHQEQVINFLEEVQEKLGINDYSLLQDVLCELGHLRAKLSGYRKAKEEFNKKVEELKKEIKIIMLQRNKGHTTSNIYFNITKKIDKIFKEENHSPQTKKNDSFGVKSDISSSDIQRHSNKTVDTQNQEEKSK